MRSNDNRQPAYPPFDLFLGNGRTAHLAPTNHYHTANYHKSLSQKRIAWLEPTRIQSFKDISHMMNQIIDKNDD